MDIFGYSFFVSFILAPLPGLLVSFLKRFNEEKASEWSLSFLIILDTILCVLGLFEEMIVFVVKWAAGRSENVKFLKWTVVTTFET